MFLNTWAVLNHLRHARVEGGGGHGMQSTHSLGKGLCARGCQFRRQTR